ncbi:galectin-related protein A-like isoform X1 [Notechis scutatus]|uniref:Galectin n=1 Tax=Notechis scutatus TaxID=8663 RepID=A0A6J1UEM9_9SAUR|nr:galectin-related protein A-like isoform X1 [Notechis scutatus]
MDPQRNAWEDPDVLIADNRRLPWLVTYTCTTEKYVGDIKGGLRPTMKITIMGMIYPSPKSFSVTLLCEPKDDHATRDIGLLLVVSFSEKSIVRNSQIAGKWGKEEKTIPYFPFTAEDSFKMELLCEHQQIRILLDGRQLCSFSHRVQPVQRMTVLQISGDLKLTKVA